MLDGETGSGQTCPDATGVRTSGPVVRSERSSEIGDGRVYHIAFTASDPHGATCNVAVTVCVSHDKPDTTCVDQGSLHASTACP